MAGNLTQHGLENFNGYDGNDSNFMIAKTSKKKVPSGSINFYAPGSPKPMKDAEQDYEMATTNMAKVRQTYSGLGITTRLIDKDESSNEHNGAIGTNVDDDVKEGRIKYLIRQVTTFQARVHQLEAMKEKFEAALKEKDYELTRAKEHIITLSQINSQLSVQQKSQNMDVATFENVEDKEALFREIASLRMENSSLKKRQENLVNEISSLRESRSLVEQSQGSSGSGSLSLMSTQECNKELESLHQVVDSLKNTVIQQRNYLMKRKAPQMAASLPAESRVTTKAGPIVAGTTPSQELPRFRQGEEGTASPYPVLSAGNSPKSSRQLKTSALSVHGTIVGSSKGLDRANAKAQESVMHLAGLDVCNQLPAVQAGAFSDDMRGDVDKLNSPLYGSDLMYVNSINDVPVRPHSNSPKLSNHGIAVKCASPKRDSAVLVKNTKEERPQERPVRKISTEIIRPGTAPALPARSKTENFGYNPQRKSQVLTEPNSQWRTSAPTAVPNSHQPVVTQARWQDPSVGPSLTKPAPTNLSQMPVQISAQSSQYNVPPKNWPVFSAASGLGECVADMARSQGAAAEVQSTPEVAYVPMNSRRDSVDCGLSQPPRDRLNSDRLCPVCNGDFGSLSIDEFQSHVLECFDNESGPETIVAEDVPPQRVCPMCNTSFGDNMSQGEFEKHVHSHFGEEMPGENFEFLQP